MSILKKQNLSTNQKRHHQANSKNICLSKKMRYDENRDQICLSKKMKYDENRDQICLNRKKSYNENKGTIKYDILLKKRKENYEKGKANSPQDKVQKFKMLIQEGPFYICVVCNRCLYKRSVLRFNPEKYENLLMMNTIFVTLAIKA